jgi:hypothetical protein
MHVRPNLGTLARPLTMGSYFSINSHACSRGNFVSFSEEEKILLF